MTHSLCNDTLTMQQVLVKFVSSAEYMGKLGAPSLCHSYFMKSLAFVMLLINAVVLILPGGGFFGDLIRNSATCEFTIIALAIHLNNRRPPQ